MKAYIAPARTPMRAFLDRLDSLRLPVPPSCVLDEMAEAIAGMVDPRDHEDAVGDVECQRDHLRQECDWLKRDADRAAEEVLAIVEQLRCLADTTPDEETGVTLHTMADGLETAVQDLGV